MSGTTWSEVLDSFEAELAALHSAIPSDIPGTKSFIPPAGIGPLPPHLAKRAASIVSQIETASTTIDEAMTATRRQASQAGALSGRAPLPASSVDISA